MSIDNTYQRTEAKLRAHLRGEIKQDIQNRILELKYPRSEPDEIDVKVTTSKKAGSPQERAVTNLMQDRKLAVLRRRQLTISNYLHSLTQVEYEILSQYYLKRKTWHEVAQAVNYSERHCRRVREHLIFELADKLAWDI